MTADPVMPSDEDLVAAFVAGDEQAYATLLERYERRVYGIAYRFFGDPADAEDASQNAFLTLYRKAGTFQGTAKFSTWMYRVTTNACNDLGRKRSRRPKKADAVPEDLQVADDTDHLGQRMLALELRKALLQLDPDHRDAVVGHTVEGRPYHELAAVAGVAVGTMKSRVHRGHAKLAAILAASGLGDSGTQAPAGRDPTLSDGEPRSAEPSDRAPPPT